MTRPTARLSLPARLLHLRIHVHSCLVSSPSCSLCTLVPHFFPVDMFRFVLVLVAAAYASAFAPAARVSRASSLSMAMEGMSKSVPFLRKPKNLDG